MDVSLIITATTNISGAKIIKPNNEQIMSNKRFILSCHSRPAYLPADLSFPQSFSGNPNYGINSSGNLELLSSWIPTFVGMTCCFCHGKGGHMLFNFSGTYAFVYCFPRDKSMCPPPGKHVSPFPSLTFPN